MILFGKIRRWLVETKEKMEGNNMPLNQITSVCTAPLDLIYIYIHYISIYIYTSSRIIQLIYNT